MSLDNVQVHLIETMEDVADFKEWLGRSRPRNAISFDTESTGLNKQTDTVRLIQFGDAEHGWAMSFEAWRGVAEDVFRRFDGMFDTANGSFDLAMCRNMSMSMPDTSRFNDVRAMTHPLDGTQSTALKSLATRLVDARAADAQTDLKQAIATYGWDGVPIEFPPYWCVPLDTEILTRSGWKTYADVRPGDETLGYENGRLVWTKVTGSQNFSNAPIVQLGNSRWSVECTPQHRWVMEKSGVVQTLPLDQGWKGQDTKLILSAPAVGGDSDLSSGEAAILAWVLSDGHVEWQRPDTKTSPITHIIQHPNKFSDEIRDLLRSENAYKSERILKTSGCVSFYIQATRFQDIWNRSGLSDRSVSDLVLDLSVDARRSWFDAWYKAEGTIGRNVISQNVGPLMDALSLCAYLEGYAQTIRVRSQNPRHAVMYFSNRYPTSQKTKISDAGRADVWCPTTELGTWTARDRNGRIFVTGNTYAAIDTVLTTQVTDVLLPRVQAECPQAYDLELATMWVTDRMEHYGAHVDQAYVKRAADEFEQFIEAAGKWCKDAYGVSAGSSQQVVNALIAEGHDFTERTATGLFKLDKDVLESINHPLAQTVLKRRQVEKLAKSYLRHFSEEADGDDLIHCSINTIGARTGRMSITNPALQTLPRFNTRNTAANTVRNCISARPGHTLLMCDFDQIEMRVLAYLSKDQGMRDAFLSDRDFFIAMACQIYGLDDMKKSDERRNLTKGTSYGKVYGAGIQKLAETAGVEFMEAKRFMDKFDSNFPGISTYIDSLMQTAQENRLIHGVPCVFSPLTGRRHVGDRMKEYALTNYMIQGLAAELFKTKLLEIDASGLGQWLMLPVHDEVILDVPHEHVPHAVRTLEEIMNDVEMIAPIPVTASVSYGLRWGSKTDWKDERTWRDLLVTSDAA